jgi:hypothetical protein
MDFMRKFFTRFMSAGLPVVLSVIFLWQGQANAFSSYLNSFNSLYGTSGSVLDECTLCHGASKSPDDLNPYGADFMNSGYNFVNIEPLDSDGDSHVNLDEITARTLPGDAASYPQVGSVCTDLDGDNFAIEGGECGPVDCNDNDASINPGAEESCTDGIDNNCNDLIDAEDPAAVSCPAENPMGERFGIYRSGTWYLDANRNGKWDTGTDTTSRFGMSTDVPVTGDWNGDGTAQFGAYRNGVWYLDSNGNGVWDDSADARISFGGSLTDIPVAGDWNGNGITQVGVFRNGTWYLDADGDGAWNAGIDTLTTFGMAGDIPVAGDWNGDGTTQIGVYRDGTWYLDINGNGSWETGTDLATSFGLPTDLPVAGDWNGDGTTQIGVYRNGKWYLDTNANGIWESGVDKVYTSFGGGDNDLPVILR